MKRSTIIIAALVGALGLATLFYGFSQQGLRRSGRALSAHFNRGASKVVIVDRERVRDSAMVRVHVHDARTGAELARTPLRTEWFDRSKALSSDHGYDCIPASQDRLWCRDRTGDDGLSLRSLDTLAVIADEKRLHQLAPGLAQGLLDRIGQSAKPMIDLDDGALFVTGKDGRFYRISDELHAQVEPPRAVDRSDPAAFAKWATDTMHKENLGLPAHAILFERRTPLIRGAQLGEQIVTLAPEATGRRQIIAVRGPSGAAAAVDEHAFAGFADDDAPPRPPAHAAVPVAATPHPDQSFLDAGFLADPDWGALKPVILENPPSLVLAHVELAGANRTLVLSRVNGKGELAWSCSLDAADEVKGAALSGDVLVVALGDSLVGVDPATGAVRYRIVF